ncbi:MAG TPA: BtpA/SgcQ family protein, partial [Pyrinomonadaceae bacterium]
MSFEPFRERVPLVAMIHVGALPGAPASEARVDELAERAAREASLYRGCGVDGLMVENMHDTPYMRGRVGPEIVAAMAVVCR